MLKRMRLLMLFACFGLCACAAELPEAEPPLLVLGDMHFKNYTRAIIEKINQCKPDGLVEAHQFVVTDPEFVDALLRARKRGVNVTLYHSERQADMCDRLQELQDAGVHVKKVVTHEKTTIIQQTESAKSITFIGSANPTVQAYYQPEAGIVSADPQLAQEVIDIWRKRDTQPPHTRKRKSPTLSPSPTSRPSSQEDRKFRTPKRSRPNRAFASETVSPKSVMHGALQSIPVKSPRRKDIAVTLPNVQLPTLEALLETANKENTYLQITIDAQALKKKSSQVHAVLGQLKAHSHVTLNIFNPQQHGRLVKNKTVPALLHSKIMVRGAEEGSSVRPLYLTSTGNATNMGREEENITVASLVSHEDAAAAIAKIKEIPGEPYRG